MKIFHSKENSPQLGNDLQEMIIYASVGTEEAIHPSIHPSPHHLKENFTHIGNEEGKIPLFSLFLVFFLKRIRKKSRN